MTSRLSLLRTILSLLLLVVVGMTAVLSLYLALPDYQQDRVRTFLNPAYVPADAFTIDQPHINLNQGVGSGHLQGTQTSFPNPLVLYFSTLLTILLIVFTLTRPFLKQLNSQRLT